MSYLTSLKSESATQWRAAVFHRFTDELLAGTLPNSVFRHYLIQDYQFCDAFTALLGQACASAPMLASRLHFAAQLGMFASAENTYFIDAFDALKVSEADRVHPLLSDATINFDRVMREAIESRSYAACLAVLYVAEALYLDWAKRADSPGVLQATRFEHVNWVDLHRGPAFSSWVHWLGAELETYPPTTKPEQELVTSLFFRAVICEREFFDSAYER